MYYSITFENASGEKKNTWSDWQLIPTTPPVFNPPEPVTNYVEIPGRKAGPIDLSAALGELAYNNVEGDWGFVASDDALPRVALFEELKNFLHGKQMKVYLEEDPWHYHVGRILVGSPQSRIGPVAYTLHYTVGPLRYAMDGTEDGF